VTKGLRLADEELWADAAVSGLSLEGAAARVAGAAHEHPHGRPRDDELPSGTIVHGKFRIIGVRPRAGDELAFKALHLGTGRRVELRLLPEGVPASGPEADRMLRAARAAGRAPHSNVLNVVDSGVDLEQRPFVVYEQFAGVPCSAIVPRRGPCELRVAADIVCQVLDGLSALHGRGVFHRQVRPENVLVDGTLEELRVKLVGLGYSLQRGRESEAPELPRGYSRYLAPEARRGEALATPAVDIYACGVLLRYLLTGDAAPNVALSPAVERALTRALAADPDERFQSAEQFRACVSAIVGPTARESLLPSGSLLSDLRFMLRRRQAADEELGRQSEPPDAGPDGALELYPVLLIIESLYARVGALGWSALLGEQPDVEQLLPAAGLGEQLRDDGVSAALVTAMLRQADTFSGRANLRLVAELGEELSRRGLRRFCVGLPAQLTPEALVACVPVIWRSVMWHGDVVLSEQSGGSARITVRSQRQASLELGALFAGLLRGQLRLTHADSEVNWTASEALGDGADVFVLSW
jgi:eukaryotic-like serine/threonine-protein kinase